MELDDEGEFRVFSIEIPSDLEVRLLDEAMEAKIDELERLEEETGERQHTLISEDDLDLDWSQVPEDLIQRADVTPDNFGRIAAQTAKQVIQQRIREAERAMMYEEYVDRAGRGRHRASSSRRATATTSSSTSARSRRCCRAPSRSTASATSRARASRPSSPRCARGTKGPQVILSRRDPELIKTLFELEVPEIADGLVEIRGVAREPGYRSKIAVESHAQGVDPVGACVGPRGSRVRMVVSELRGEKIDIIPWNTEPARFVAKALSPARVREVYIDDETKRSDGRRPQRPARARDRQGGPERPPGRAPDRVEGRHPVRRGVRARRGRGGLRRRGRRGRGVHRPLRRHPLERQALPEHRAAELEVLRRAGAPGARRHRGRRRGCGRRGPSQAEVEAAEQVEAESPRRARRCRRSDAGRAGISLPVGSGEPTPVVPPAEATGPTTHGDGRAAETEGAEEVERSEA